MESTLTRPDSRIDIADVLRGFAVMGIIILHSIEHFNFYSFPDTSNQSTFLNFTDKAIWDSLFFIFGGKAYAIFALLFGFSFYIQDANQTKKGNDFRMRFVWRLFLLFVLGNLNAMFFTAEILVLYSLVGIVLVLVCRFSDKTVLIIGTLLLFQPFEIYKIIMTIFNPDIESPAKLSGYYFHLAKEVQENGNFWETAKMNLWEGQLASLTWAWEHGRMFQTAALFMFGMVIGRKGLFLKSEKNLYVWLKILLFSIMAYFPLKGLDDLLPSFIPNRNLLFSLRMVLQSLFKCAFMFIMVSGIILAFYNSSRIKKIFLKLTPYGRMSLTNYITQSMIGSFLFYNWGLGLHRYLGITASFIVGILLFLLQYAFCKWWMYYHRQGPFEYLWKKGTWIKI